MMITYPYNSLTISTAFGCFSFWKKFCVLDEGGVAVAVLVGELLVLVVFFVSLVLVLSDWLSLMLAAVSGKRGTVVGGAPN